MSERNESPRSVVDDYGKDSTFLAIVALIVLIAGGVKACSVLKDVADHNGVNSSPISVPKQP